MFWEELFLRQLISQQVLSHTSGICMISLTSCGQFKIIKLTCCERDDAYTGCT